MSKSVCIILIIVFTLFGILMLAEHTVKNNDRDLYCPTSKIIIQCESELIDEYIADHPDVCDGLCKEQCDYEC